MKTYGLIKPDNVPSGIDVVLDVPDLDDPKSRKVYYKDDSFLISYRSSYGNDPDDLVENQIELPLSSLSWVVTSIENGLWKDPSDGEFPSNKHGINKVFDNEEILILRSMYAGTDKPGFKIVNKSRSSHIRASSPQSLTFTDEFGDKYLLPLLKNL